MVRTESNAGAMQHVSPHQAGVESADEAPIAIDFPSTPDDVRRQSQTISRLGRAGFAAGVSGVAISVLGTVGFVAGAYFCLDAAAEVDDSEAANQNRRTGYGVGTTMALLSAAAVTYGLSQVYRSIMVRRQAAQQITSLNTRVLFDPNREGGRP
ncbi:hypothetical protein [Pandoraea sp. NPDC087047]|uniref:hypothetical protein n=1 Tax=Pandoraea sp. NPDC087047 TaxID=3364390 RepID=UPI00382684C8